MSNNPFSGGVENNPFHASPITDPPYQKRPYACPVCKGKGFTRKGFTQNSFHGNLENYTLIDTECKSCSGTGIVWG